MNDFKAGRGFNPQQLKQYTTTTDGLAWLIKHLHPPGSDPKPAGLPDRDCQMSAVTDYDIMSSVTAPTGTGNWSAVIYTLPHIEYLAFVIKWRDAQPDITTTEVIQNDKVVLSFPKATSGEQLNDILTANRMICRSSTVHLNCGAINNQGMVYAIQLRGGRNRNPASGLAAAHQEPRSVIDLGHVLTNGGDVTMSSAKPYIGEARDGSYIPVGFIQSTSEYIAPYDSKVYEDGSSKEGYEVVVTYSKEVAGVDTQYQYRLTDNTMASLPFDDMAVGVHLYSGIDSTASLNIRNVLINEVVPSFRSPWVPFQTPGATPDSMAVDNAYVIRQLMPDGFPASANFWGALAGLASTILPSLVGWAVPKLQTWLGTKSAPKAPTPAPRQPPAAPTIVLQPQMPAKKAPTPAPRKPPAPQPAQRGRSATRRAKSAAPGRATAV